MAREPSFGKNVSLKASNYNLVIEQMDKNSDSFSGALNRIIEEWDRIVMELYRFKKLQENHQKTIKDVKFNEKNKKR